jgi:hypothetical protein
MKDPQTVQESPEPWEQQPGESNRWYARFERFRLAGPSRSLLGAVNTARQDGGKGSARSVPQAWAKASRPAEHVLDLFGGSGSTLIAAEQTGRHAFLMELDPLYCDVIVQRWQNFTGRQAERSTNGRPNPRTPSRGRP